MKETGVVRRLDELGRVVIPKEIRKRLKIKNGDMVDIFTNNEYIILQKYHPLSQDIAPAKALLEALKKEQGCEFVLFDDAKIMYSTDNKMDSGDIVCPELIRRINSLLDKELSNKLKLSIADGVLIEKDILISKIIVDYEPYGYIAVIDKIIMKKHKDILELIKNYFNHILES